MEKIYLVTPYSTYTLGSNGNFSHEKAEKELGYSVRHPLPLGIDHVGEP